MNRRKIVKTTLVLCFIIACFGMGFYGIYSIPEYRLVSNEEWEMLKGQLYVWNGTTLIYSDASIRGVLPETGRTFLYAFTIGWFSLGFATIIFWMYRKNCF